MNAANVPINTPFIPNFTTKSIATIILIIASTTALHCVCLYCPNAQIIVIPGTRIQLVKPIKVKRIDVKGLI